MCAINGIYAYHYAANSVERGEVLTTRDAMASRGPDGAGVWFDENARIAIGHRRLAIIEPSEAGQQPMQSICGRYVISFNGEIYNHRELRIVLARQGHVFRTRSDTEVLLELYKAEGRDFVRRLRGMFALAIWDKGTRQLLLARDPFGIKPLYYADDGWTFRFASQVSALVDGGGVSREPDIEGQVGFYLCGAVPDPGTTNRAIQAIPAGATLIVDRIGSSASVRFYSVSGAIRAAESQSAKRAGVQQWLDQVVATAVRKSVAHHLVSDVPVGAFLSSGIDSAVMVGLMRECTTSRIKTITIRFEEFAGQEHDEGELARQIAEQFETEHIERVVTKAEFCADLPSFLKAMDQPSLDGINTWFAAKAAREQGIKVVISGLGGDELFGGYHTFTEVPQQVRRYGLLSQLPLLGLSARLALSHCWRALDLHPKAVAALELSGTCSDAYLLRRGLFLPWEIKELLHRAASSARLSDSLKNHRTRVAKLIEGLRSPFGKLAALEMSLYLKNQLLRDADWASMAHGVEVRVPLVDHELLNSCMPILLHDKDPHRKARVARAAVPALSDAVLRRPKTGFSTPVRYWLADIVKDRSEVGRHRAAQRLVAPWPRLWARHWAYFIADQKFSLAH